MLRFAVFLDDRSKARLALLRAGRLTLEIVMQGPHLAGTHLHVEWEIELAPPALVMPHGGGRLVVGGLRRRSEQRLGTLRIETDKVGRGRDGQGRLLGL